MKQTLTSGLAEGFSTGLAGIGASQLSRVAAGFSVETSSRHALLDHALDGGGEVGRRWAASGNRARDSCAMSSAVPPTSAARNGDAQGETLADDAGAVFDQRRHHRERAARALEDVERLGLVEIVQEPETAADSCCSLRSANPPVCSRVTRSKRPMKVMSGRRARRATGLIASTKISNPLRRSCRPKNTISSTAPGAGRACAGRRRAPA